MNMPIICSIIFTFRQSIGGSTARMAVLGNTAVRLTGAVPTPYYRAGEALMKQDYEKVLKNRIHDRTVPIRDRYRQEQEYREKRTAHHSVSGWGAGGASKVWNG